MGARTSCQVPDTGSLVPVSEYAWSEVYTETFHMRHFSPTWNVY